MSEEFLPPNNTLPLPDSLTCSFCSKLSPFVHKGSELKQISLALLDLNTKEIEGCGNASRIEMLEDNKNYCPKCYQNKTGAKPTNFHH